MIDKEQIRKKDREYYWKNREKILDRKKEIRIQDPERFRAYSKKARDKNREEINEKAKIYMKEYRQRPEVKEYRREWTNKYRNIKRIKEGRPPVKKVNIPKELLYQKYEIEGESAYDIGKELNVGSTTIYRYLNKYNIQRRSISEACKGREIWNDGLTKEIDERVKKSVEKSSETKKRLYKEGKIKPWNKDLTKETDSRIKTPKFTYKKGHRNWNTGLHIRLNPKGEFKKGKDHLNWKNGISFEPYGLEFNKELREQIRKRDNYRCQQCFRHQDELRTKTNRKCKLAIHHIDFNKQNNNPDNLISLCNNCHSQTGFNRENWIKYFQNKINIGGNKI